LDDFVGVAALFFVSQLLSGLGGKRFFPSDGRRRIMFDPFTNVLVVLIVIAAIAFSAVCIYNLDKKLLRQS
jgi:hypothetical protein